MISQQNMIYELEMVDGEATVIVDGPSNPCTSKSGCTPFYQKHTFVSLLPSQLKFNAPSKILPILS